MKTPQFSDFEINIARTRMVLSLLAMVSLFIDPSTAGGLFHLTRYALVVLLLHLAYSVAAYAAFARGLVRRRFSNVTLPMDLLFATLIAYLTEGQTSPAYIFFVFAIIAVGMRTGMKATLMATSYSVTLYLLVIALSDGISSFYLMRAVYLAIAGYLVGFFGEQRAKFEERMREFETRAQRHSIARDLHDSYVQCLAAVNLRLETCRELLRGERAPHASKELRELQMGVAREYDQVRGYLRSLTGSEPPPEADSALDLFDPRVEIHAAVVVRSATAERILQIMLEGLRNTRKHARAHSVRLEVSEVAQDIVITISDDGLGFPADATAPWTIASHVAETGGHINISDGQPARLEVAIPNLEKCT